MSNSVLTIGHSAHSLEAFIALLQQHGVEVVADVRSQPYSRRFPQFSRPELQATLKSSGMQYVFLGRELGARREERQCYVDGQARYDLIARQPLFAEGLRRLANGIQQFRVALLCAEKDPLTCHRTILVCRHLKKRGFQMAHILEDGSIESQEAAEKRLLLEEGFNPDQADIFSGAIDNEAALDRAYVKRGERIAYHETNGTEDEDTYDRVHPEIR